MSRKQGEWMRGQMSNGLRGILIVALAGSASIAHADRACAPVFQNWPVGAPVQDGNVASDVGYASGFRYTFSDGTSEPNGAFQMVRSGDNHTLYLSVEVSNAMFDVNNMVVLAFDTGGAGNGPYKVMQFFPINGSGSGPPSYSVYSVDAGDLHNPGNWHNVTVPSTFLTGSAGTLTGTSGAAQWQLEVAIPLVDLGINTTTDNLFYLNILPVDTTMGTTVQLRWPLTADVMPGRDIGSIPLTGWGSFNPSNNSCLGVWIGLWQTGDITATIDNPSPTGGYTDLTFNTTKANYFHALVHNSGPAANVTAQFKIQNAGTSYAPWAPIQATDVGFPTDAKVGPQSVSGDTWFTLGPWHLSTTQVTQYQGKHECMLVELDSPDNGTVFIQKSGFQNMNFDVASAVTERPEINTNGLGPAPAGMGSHKFAYQVNPSLQFAYSDGSNPNVPVGTFVSQMKLIFHAYHYTGKNIIIKGTSYNIIEPGPSFGYTFQHTMPLAFKQAFEERHTRLAEPLKVASNADNSEKAMLTKVAVYRRVNELLKTDAEKPANGDWAWQADGLKAVGNTKGLWYTVDVAPNSVLPLTLNIGAYQVNGPGFCCAANAQKTTTPVGALLVIVGLLAYRGHRRRD